jgi:hypothetical protein
MPWKTLDDMNLRRQGGAGAGGHQRADGGRSRHRHHPHRGKMRPHGEATSSGQGRQGGAAWRISTDPRARSVAEMSPCRWCSPALEAALGAEVGLCRGLRTGAAKRCGVRDDLLRPWFCCLKTHAFPRDAKRRTMPAFAAAAGWAGLATSTSTMRFRRRTGRMPRPTGVARLLPACAGRQMAAELKALEAALWTRPERPVAAVVGGAKVSTKIELLANHGVARSIIW